ncbi:hypothetical protein [Frankia sp. Cj3]|uniref:hypothetical protein n=1 Tax=Frankia sp. Cj3 TaxID=2880976 RepID=UPI001EF57C84|nr:hypothetical protein [Frankia sp. Cj3]
MGSLVDLSQLAELAGLTPDDVAKIKMGGDLFPVPLPPVMEATAHRRDAWRWDRHVAEVWAADYRHAHVREIAEQEAAQRQLRDLHQQRRARLGALVGDLTECCGVPVYHPARPLPAIRPDRYVYVDLPAQTPRNPSPQPRVEGYRDGERIAVDAPRSAPDGRDLPRDRDLCDAAERVALAVGTPESDRIMKILADCDPVDWRRAAADLSGLLAGRLRQAMGTREAAAARLGVTSSAVGQRTAQWADALDNSARYRRAVRLAELIGATDLLPHSGEAAVG